MLFNDTWSQEGHSVSCMIILFLNLQITRSDIKSHIKSALRLHMVTFNLPQGFVWVQYVWANILTLSPPSNLNFDPQVKIRVQSLRSDICFHVQLTITFPAIGTYTLIISSPGKIQHIYDTSSVIDYCVFWHLTLRLLV